MPRRVGGWQTRSAPHTHAQREAFIDGCVRWLVHEPPADDAPEEFLATTVDGPRSAAPVRMVAMDCVELRVPVNRRCLFCDATTARTVLANPFAQRCYMTMCDACDLSP